MPSSSCSSPKIKVIGITVIWYRLNHSGRDITGAVRYQGDPMGHLLIFIMIVYWTH